MILPLDSDLDPVVNRGFWEQVSRDVEMQKDEVAHCKDEPWYWLVNYVYTVQRDEFADKATVSRFPADEYLRYVLNQCFIEPKLAIDKSRQMRMTWLMMAYELYNAQFNENELICVQTKKQQDADEELVKRAHVMWKHQPDWLRPDCRRSFCRMDFPSHNSLILGIPNGGDQIRSHNPSRMFIDETGFLEGDFDECRIAALACAQDIKLVSSASMGQWSDFLEVN